jgi:imidazolonepropionase-like amidohydrolase
MDPRANAATLARAGVPIVFASFGGEGGPGFRERIRTSIEGGLSADDALRAATIGAATLLGIANVTGTIETGKLANLVVVNGNDLFAASTPVRHVFVEGRMYTIEGGSPPRSGGPGAPTRDVRSPRPTRGN